MPAADELDDELRDLQSRAYGRGGGLTETEAARLRELEQGRRGEPAATASRAAGLSPSSDVAVGSARRLGEPERGHGMPEATPPTDSGTQVGGAGTPWGRSGTYVVDTGAEGTGPSTDSGTEGPDSSTGSGAQAGGSKTPVDMRRILRAQWRPIAVAALLLVVVGVGVGWLLFDRTALPPVVPAAQQDTVAMIEDDGYDPGSVRYVGEKHGVGIWRATRDKAVTECVVLTRGETLQSGCQPAAAEKVDTSAPGLTASIDFADGDDTVAVWVTILPDIHGEDRTIVQRHVIIGEEGTQQFTPEERRDIEALDAAGLDPSGLFVIGYDGDTMVWQGYRAAEMCLGVVVDAEAQVECAQLNELGDVLQLRVGETAYELQQTPRGQTFTIIRTATASEGLAAPGDRLVVGEDEGDPIELTPDAPQG